MKPNHIRQRLERLKGKRSSLQESLTSKEEELSSLRHDLRRHEKAKEIIRIVGMKTQEQLQFHIADIVSSALSAVFPDPYELHVEFTQRHNKTECDLIFLRDGKRIEDPTDETGVGPINVASFALRIASWSMMEPRPNPVIVMDEPFRNLSKNYQTAASAMLKQLSEKLGLQFIIVTHEELLAEHADRTFLVTKRKRVSKVQML